MLLQRPRSGCKVAFQTCLNQEFLPIPVSVRLCLSFCVEMTEIFCSFLTGEVCGVFIATPPAAFSFTCIFFGKKPYCVIFGKLSSTLVKGRRSGSLAAVCQGFGLDTGTSFWVSSWTEARASAPLWSKLLISSP